MNVEYLRLKRSNTEGGYHIGYMTVDQVSEVDRMVCKSQAFIRTGMPSRVEVLG